MKKLTLLAFSLIFMGSISLFSSTSENRSLFDTKTQNLLSKENCFQSGFTIHSDDAASASTDFFKKKTKNDDEDDEGFWDFDWPMRPRIKVIDPDIDWKSSLKFERPTIDFAVGYSKLSIHPDVFDGKFANTYNMEIRLGYTDISENIFGARILKNESSYLFLGNASDELIENKDIKEGDLTSKTWRFGISWSEGYGYRIGGETDISFYNMKSLVWTKVDFVNKFSVYSHQTLEDSTRLNRLDLFDGVFRFGKSFEGGVRVKLFNPVTISASYEQALVFPRHMFWYWVGSETIEIIAEAALDNFVNAVFRASPYAGPIVDALLKNGLSYGLYQLYKKNMNWPFDTDAPLMYENFRISLGFVF